MNNKSTIELTGKIVSLDSNIELVEGEDINNKVIEILKNQDFIWSWSVVDTYMENSITRYTVRVEYFNLSDQEAKALNEKLFN